MKRLKSIKFKVAAASTLIFLAALILISIIQVRQLHTETARTLADQQFTLVTRVAAELDEKLEIRRAILASEASTLPPDIAANEAKLRARFTNEISLHTLFDSFSVISAKGAVTYTTQEIEGWRTVNLTDRPYFREVMQTRAPVITEPFLSKLQKRPRISIAAPVFDAQDNVVAIIVGSLDLLNDNFLGAIGKSRIGKEGYFYIVANGPNPIYITHRIKSRIMQSAKESAAKNPSLARALHGFEGTLEGTNSYGLEGIFSFKTLQNVNWVLAAVLPVNEAFEPITRTERTTVLAAIAISILVATLVWVVVYRLLEPLEKLRARMHEAISNPGNTAPELDGTASDEIGALTRKFNELMTARDRAEEELAHVARHDFLTGLPNRMLFNDRFEQTLHRNRRNRHAFALMYIDVDYFKSINDSLGHSAGDMLLVQFAHRAKTAVRASDTVARLGGDEFAVILDNVAMMADAESAAIKIVVAMRGEFQLAEGAARATASIGVAFVKDLSQQPEAIFKAADEALYEAKAKGRNGYQLKEV